MENASKALLIAGSVLIAILVIGFGMKIFNTTAEPASEVEGTMITAAMTTFNNKFLKYSGSQRGSSIKALANEIIANNTNSARKVSFEADGQTSASAIMSAISSVQPMASYNVTIKDTDNDGYIDYIEFS